MIRHIVLMSFTETASDEYLAELAAGLTELAAAVPDIAAATWGADITGRRDNYDYALVFDFADPGAYERYRHHPAHLAFIERFMKGRAIEKVRVQYALAGRGEGAP